MLHVASEGDLPPECVVMSRPLDLEAPDEASDSASATYRGGNLGKSSLNPAFLLCKMGENIEAHFIAKTQEITNA